MRCPTCNTLVPPGTRFCPTDGTPLAGGAIDALAALADAPATPPPSAMAVPAPARTSPASLVAVGVLALAVAALAAVILLRPAPQAAPPPSAPERPTVVQTVPPAPDNEVPAALPPVPVAVTPPAGDYRMIATPADGFLSIRSEPDGRGSRLDRMLDGEVVEVLTCGPARVVDGDPGHWCRVRRQTGQTGWAYDAYLVAYLDSPM